MKKGVRVEVPNRLQHHYGQYTTDYPAWHIYYRWLGENIGMQSEAWQEVATAVDSGKLAFEIVDEKAALMFALKFV